MNKDNARIESEIKETKVRAEELTKLGSNATGTIKKTREKVAKKIKKILKS